MGRDQMLSPPFSEARNLCWDATCVNTFGQIYINETAILAGLAASKAENTKRAKYPDLVRNFRFDPIAIETSGVFGSSTSNIINEIGKYISERTGEK